MRNMTMNCPRCANQFVYPIALAGTWFACPNEEGYSFFLPHYRPDFPDVFQPRRSPLPQLVAGSSPAVSISTAANPDQIVEILPQLGVAHDGAPTEPVVGTAPHVKAVRKSTLSRWGRFWSRIKEHAWGIRIEDMADWVAHSLKGVAGKIIWGSIVLLLVALGCKLW